MASSRSHSRSRTRKKKKRKETDKSRHKSCSRSRRCSSKEKKGSSKDKKGRRRSSSNSSSKGSRSRSHKRGRRSRDRDTKKRSSTPPRKKRSSSRKRRSRDRKKSRSKSKRRSRSRKTKGCFGKDAETSAAPAVAVAAVAQPQSAAAVPDWLSDLMGGAPTTQAVPSEPLQIPGALASVITNECAAIKTVMAQTGATVSIRGDCMHLGYSLAFFTGAPQAVAQAREMMLTQIGLSENTTITKEIEMSAELLAEGHVDAVLETLRQRGTLVPINVMHTDSTKNLVKIVLGPGPVAYVSTAESLMRKKIDGWLTDGGRQLCGQFRKGNCTFGANCKFRHGLELSSRKVATVPQAGPSLEALPAPPPPPPGPPLIDNLPPRTSLTSGML